MMWIVRRRNADFENRVSKGGEGSLSNRLLETAENSSLGSE